MTKVTIYYTTGRKAETVVEDYNPLKLKEEIRDTTDSHIVVGDHLVGKNHILAIEKSEVQ